MARKKKLKKSKIDISTLSNNYLNNSLLGQRYVFFSELNETNPGLAKAATTHFSHINQQFFEASSETNKNNDKLLYMQEYLNMLYQLMQNERQAESNYLTKLSQNIIISSPYFEKNISSILKELENISTGQPINYLYIINLLNVLKQDEKDYQQALSNQIENINIYMHNLQQKSEKETKTIKQVEEEIKKIYTENHAQYEDLIKSLKKGWKDSITNKTYTWNESMLNKICQQIDNQIIAARDTPALRKTILEMIQETTGKYDLNILKRILIMAGLKNKDLSAAFLNDNTFNKTNFKDLLSSLYSDTNIEAAFNKHKQQYETIEQAALAHGEKLGQMFLDLEEVDKQNFLSRYEQYIDKDKINQIRNKIDNARKIQNSDNNSKKYSIAAYKGQLTIEIKQAISKAQEQVILALKNGIQSEVNALTDEEKNELFLSTINIKYDSIAASLDLIVNYNSVAEIVNMPEFKESIPELGGVSKPIKNDVIITWSWNQAILKKLIKQNKSNIEQLTLLSRLESKAKTIYHSYMERYKKLSNNTINIEKSAKAYIEEMFLLAQDLKRAYNSLKEDAAAQKQLIEFIDNMILESITVKEYNEYSPTIGYSASSLGGSGRVSSVIPNILKMYELGGITTIEANTIIEALYNASDDKLAPNDLIENFKNYLLGGAAMVLFDEGFANTEAFLEKMKKMFFNNIAPQQVHLLLLNGKYYPFSFILQQIYQNLYVVYNDILNFVEKPTTIFTTHSLHINNQIQLPQLNEWEALNIAFPKDAPKRWNYVSKMAEENVTISFTFMGGLLDILNNLQQSFNL